MRYIICLILLLGTSVAIAQSPSTNFKYGISLNNLSSMQRTTTLTISPIGAPVSQERTTTLDALHLVPSFIWQTKKGNFAQVSVPLWQMQRVKTVSTATNYNQTVGENRRLNLGVQYTYSHRFLKQKAGKWLPMLGFGAMPYLQHADFQPLVTTEFGTSNTRIGLQGVLQPHVIWTATEHVFVDLGLSLSVFDFNFSSDVDHNPILPSQETSSINWSMFQGPHGIQVGAGLKI